jgi:hypothetical protein
VAIWILVHALEHPVFHVGKVIGRGERRHAPYAITAATDPLSIGFL